MKSQILGNKCLLRSCGFVFILHSPPHSVYFHILPELCQLFCYLLFSLVCYREEMWVQLTETRNNNCWSFWHPTLEIFQWKRLCFHCGLVRFSVSSWKLAKLLSISYFSFCSLFFFFSDFTIMSPQHPVRKGEPCKLIMD